MTPRFSKYLFIFMRQISHTLLKHIDIMAQKEFNETFIITIFTPLAFRFADNCTSFGVRWT